MPDATLTRLIMPGIWCLYHTKDAARRPDKAFTPHPAVAIRCLMRR
ncbi:mannitol-1-phosphate 5-dehydrogenase [Escherichia coli TA280]|nr:mannitol-1-phosphate 5-dehydrogenase [Escherichia coli TA280]